MSDFEHAMQEARKLSGTPEGKQLAALLQQLAELDAKEPKNMNSEAYEEWGDQHEELEDLLDEIQDILDDLEA